MEIESDDPFDSEVEAVIDSIGGRRARLVELNSMVYLPRSDGTRLAQASNDGGIDGGHVIGQRRESGRGAQSCGLQSIFKRNRDPVERPPDFVASQRFICLLSPCPGILFIERDNCIEGTVVSFDLCEISIDYFKG